MLVRTNTRRAAWAGALCLAAVLGAVASARAGDTKEAGLAYRLAKGDKHRAALGWDMKQAHTAMGMTQEQGLRVRIGLGHEVLEVDAAGVAKVKATIESVLFEQKLQVGPWGDVDMSYDSTGPDANKDKLLRLLGHTIGKSFTYKLGPDGAVTDVEGANKIRDDVIEKLKARLAGTRADPYQDPVGFFKKNAAVMGVMFLSDDLFRSALDVHSHVLPGAGAAADAWERATSQHLPSVLVEAKVRYEPKGPGEAHGEKGFKIVGSAPELVVKPAPAPAGVPASGMAAASPLSKLKMKSSTYTQTAIFSKDTGRLLDDEVLETAELEGTVDFPGMPGGRGGAEEDEEEEAAPKKKDAPRKTDGDGDKKTGEAKKAEKPQGPNLGLKLKLVLRWESLKGDAPKPPVIEDDKDAEGGKKAPGGGGDDEDDEEMKPEPKAAPKGDKKDAEKDKKRPL